MGLRIAAVGHPVVVAPVVACRGAGEPHYGFCAFVLVDGVFYRAREYAMLIRLGEWHRWEYVLHRFVDFLCGCYGSGYFFGKVEGVG